MSELAPRLSECPVDLLRLLAQGCTEETCIYHGEYNMELHRRGER